MSQIAAREIRMRSQKKQERRHQIVITAIVALFVLLAFIPILLMLFLSLKNNSQIIGNFWAFPLRPQWSNYSRAWSLLSINVINSLIVVTVSTTLTVCLAAMDGYVFARLEFPGKNFLFLLFLALMMIPGVLTLTPSFKLMQRLHLINSWWAIWLPMCSGGQVMGMYYCRTFINGQPASVFESARIDGATEFQAFIRIAIPLAKPILATLVVQNLIGAYNDYIWPLLVITSTRKQVIAVAIRTYQSSTGGNRYGEMIAGFVVATIPLVIMFAFSSRLYIEGLTSGAIKA